MPGKPAVRVDTFKYDALNRLELVQQAANAPTVTRTVRMGYDTADNKIRVIDGSGVETKADYDGLGQVVSERVKSNLVVGADPWTTTTYTRNVWGEATKVETPATTVSYEFDGLGRQTKQTLNAAHYIQTAYDPAGNQVLVTDRVQTLVAVAPGARRSVSHPSPFPVPGGARVRAPSTIRSTASSRRTTRRTARRF